MRAFTRRSDQGDILLIAYFIVAGLLALALLAAGGMKLARPKAALAPQMGWVHDFAGWQVKLIGAVEVIGAVGVIVPMATGIARVLSPIAAIGVAVVMAGAIVVHLRRKEQAFPSLVLLALAVATAVLGFLAR